MNRKVVLVAGASGLVGYAALKHFAGEAGCEVIAISRRRPDETFGARFIAADLTDQRACAEVFSGLASVTHVIYAALYERPGLVAGWRDPEQIAVNDRMLRNLMEPLEKAARGLAHISLLQGTKAYGVHVRPMKFPAREGRSEMREEPNFYWNQEDYLRETQRGKAWCLLDLPPRADRRLLARQRHERRAGDRRLRGDAQGEGAAAALSRRPAAGRPGSGCRFAGAMHGLGRRDRRRAQRDLQRRQRRRLLLAEHLAGDRRCGRHGAGRGRGVQPGGRGRAARGGLGAHPRQSTISSRPISNRSSASRFNMPTTRWGSAAPRRRRPPSPRRSS